MKKVLIIGGSQGIGLSIAKELIERKSFVYILDVISPQDNVLEDKSYSYHYFDLMNIDYDLLEDIKKENICSLIITAGIGRVASFANVDLLEVDKVMTINSTSTIKVINYFFDKIKAKDDFYTAVMVSIAGMISSPLFSVYAASKAAMHRFIESVNIELELEGSENRILNISPGSLKGTSFTGGKTDVSFTKELSLDIIDKMFSRSVLYIPQYDEIFRGVIERYQKDSHEFGVSSYKYKLELNRVSNNKSSIKIGYLSGTFDLFHIGHLNLLKKAKQQCDYLIVGVHPSGAHKGKEIFIPFDERKEIVESCKYVDKVIQSLPEDSDVWDIYHYHKLFVGSDYKGTQRFLNYEEYFKDKDVEIIYFPYTQGTSSSQLRNAIEKND